MTYLNIEEIAAGVRNLTAAYPDTCELIELPHASVEGRDVVALALGDMRGAGRPTAIFVGGIHAREWIPPDALLYLAADLLAARSLGSGLGYGDTAFDADAIARIFRDLQIVILPCANPDGRLHSQTVEPLWRKNRSFNSLAGGGICRGVDLNRNFDIAWDFRRKFASDTIASSDDPCHPNLYVGPRPASEPETQNVVWLMDTFPGTRWFIDVHSAIPAVFHSWGLDENQSHTPNMNFLNPVHDGVRGLPDDAYQEYIDPADLAELSRLSTLMADKIEGVRGDRYEVGPAFSLYATSGASDDYAFSRHRTGQGSGRILSFTMECGHEFQPEWDEARMVICEVDAALVGFASDVIGSRSSIT